MKRDLYQACCVFAVAVFVALSPRSARSEPAESKSLDLVRTSTSKAICQVDSKGRTSCTTKTVVSGSPVPKYFQAGVPFRTWSLFLVCDGAWLDDSNRAALDSMRQSFTHFGEAVGHHNAAIWFWVKEKDSTDSTIDVSRSSSFCESFKLLPSEGPYIIVTMTHPNEPRGTIGNPTAASVNNFIVMKLKGLSPKSSTELLSKLTDQLLVQGLNQTQLDSSAYWLGWKDAIKKLFYAIGENIKEVKVAIKGGPVDVEMKFGP